MYFSVPEHQAYRDFTRNGLTSEDCSSYPKHSSLHKRWVAAMRKLEANEHERIETYGYFPEPAQPRHDSRLAATTQGGLR